MARFVLHVKNLQTGKSEAHRVERSPVMVGRHPRNDLALEFPFVSQWHGAFRFEEDGRVYYVDQGSTNGSYLDGRRLVSAQEQELGENSDLRIGMLRLRLEKDPAAPEPEPEADAAGAKTVVSKSSTPWRTPEFADADLSNSSALPDTRPEIDPPSGDRWPSEGSSSWGAAATGDREDLWPERKDWRSMLPQPGSAPAEDFAERLKRALELLGLIVDRQSARDAVLASALEPLRRQGGGAAQDSPGEALLAYLLDPEAPVGERADEVRAKVG